MSEEKKVFFDDVERLSKESAELLKTSINSSEEKIKEKKIQIGIGIAKILYCNDLLKWIREQLFPLKDYFYGDFKYSESLQKVPDPRKLIDDAIHALERAIREGYEIEIHSI